MNALRKPPKPVTPARPLFVIARDDTGVHVYPDIRRVLDIQHIGAGEHDSIEFFDIRGCSLVPTFHESGTLSSLSENGDRPDADVVQARLRTVMQHLRATIDQRLARAGNSTITREQALSQIPDLEGRSLEECFDLLDVAFGHANSRYGGDGASRRDPGSWWHNFWCH